MGQVLHGSATKRSLAKAITFTVANQMPARGMKCGASGAIAPRSPLRSRDRNYAQPPNSAATTVK